MGGADRRCAFDSGGVTAGRTAPRTCAWMRRSVCSSTCSDRVLRDMAAMCRGVLPAVSRAIKAAYLKGEACEARLLVVVTAAAAAAEAVVVHAWL